MLFEVSNFSWFFHVGSGVDFRFGSLRAIVNVMLFVLFSTLSCLGYPPEISNLPYNPEFSVRGLWWDNLHGNMLKGKDPWFFKLCFSLTFLYRSVKLPGL